MTADSLLEEGRLLRRKCVLLKTDAYGEVAAVWHHQFPRDWGAVGFEPWLTIDTRFIPGFDSSGACFLTVSTSTEGEFGQVEVVSSLPPGLPLYAHPTEVLAPIDAIFAKGSARVGAWLDANGWERNVQYNSNFGDRAIVEVYEREWAQGAPIFGKHDNLYAVLGGWPFTNSEDDWTQRLGNQMLVVTVKDSEPWVEAWESSDGTFNVTQHIS